MKSPITDAIAERATDLGHTIAARCDPFEEFYCRWGWVTLGDGCKVKLTVEKVEDAGCQEKLNALISSKVCNHATT